MANDDELRKLLSAAEKEIVYLRGKIEECNRTLVVVVDSHGKQEKEMDALKVRITELEGLIHVSDETLSEAMIVMGGMRDAIDRLKRDSATTLERVKNTQSHMELAESLFELSAKADLSEQVEVINEYAKQIEALRAKTKPRK